MSTALTFVHDERPQGALIRPVIHPAAVMQLHDAIAEMVQKTLKENVDYGIIPGTKKPSLYKSGAERLCVGFALVDTYEIIEKEIDHNFENAWEKRDRRGQAYANGVAKGLYRYTVKCYLRRREDNALVAEGLGACSSLESKYMDRPRDSENTILKMAKKRAKIDATLSGLGLSDRFTQDVEDVGAAAASDDDRDAEQKVAKPAAERRFPMTGPFHGKLLGEMPTDAIRGYCDWIHKKQTEKGDEAFFGELLDALNEVLAARPSEAEAKQTSDAAAPDSPAPSAAAPVSDVASGDDRTRWSTAKLQAHVLSLLTHPSLSKAVVDNYRAQIAANCTKVQLVSMSAILDERIMRENA